MSRRSPEAQSHVWKDALESIASHPECPTAIYNIAADALCWARKVVVAEPAPRRNAYGLDSLCAYCGHKAVHHLDGKGRCAHARVDIEGTGYESCFCSEFECDEDHDATGAPCPHTPGRESAQTSGRKGLDSHSPAGGDVPAEPAVSTPTRAKP